MPRNPPELPANTPAQARKKRLAAALRENLRKRRGQIRPEKNLPKPSETSVPTPDTPEGG